MYQTLTMTERVRVPPKFLKEDTKESVIKALQESMEGTLDKDVGLILAVLKIHAIQDGSIIEGDGAVYYETTFDALVYKPELHEIVEGEVIEIVEFGAFVRLGPIDGLVHVSQVTDDFMSYSKEGILMGKDSGKTVKVGDLVRARVVTMSLKQSAAAKLGLTMRQPGLGKLEWLQAEKQKK